jgi:hypothetical protein
MDSEGPQGWLRSDSRLEIRKARFITLPLLAYQR